MDDSHLSNIIKLKIKKYLKKPHWATYNLQITNIQSRHLQSESAK
jgi:hypothetical protein